MGCGISKTLYMTEDFPNGKNSTALISTVCGFKSRNLLHLRNPNIGEYWESRAPVKICMKSIKLLGFSKIEWYNVLRNMSRRIYQDRKVELETPLPPCLNNIVGEYLGLDLIGDIWNTHSTHMGSIIEYTNEDIYDSDDDDDYHKRKMEQQKINNLDITQYNTRIRLLAMHASEFQDLIKNIKKYQEVPINTYDEYLSIEQTLATYASYRPDCGVWKSMTGRSDFYCY